MVSFAARLDALSRLLPAPRCPVRCDKPVLLHVPAGETPDLSTYGGICTGCGRLRQTNVILLREEEAHP